MKALLLILALVLVSPFAQADFLHWFASKAPLPDGNTLASLAGLDVDNDGRPALLEYALGSNLDLWDGPSATPRVVSGKLVLEFTRPKGLADISYIVQVSDTLTGGWQSGSAVALSSAADLGATERLVFTDARLPLSPRAFMRLAVMFSTDDSNDDGIFDAWQWQQYGSLLSSSTLLDSDGDGIPDLQDVAPRNSSIGRMSINISFPANGATLQ
jgi:hypothetical protein